MADVRLTAVNPEDSQVYPVACNDKGELLLDSGGASGDLDVTGNLTVSGSGTFAGTISHASYSSNYGFSSAVSTSSFFCATTVAAGIPSESNDNRLAFKTTYDNGVGSKNKFAIQTDGTVRIGGTIDNTADQSDENIKLSSDGSASFDSEVISNYAFTAGDRVGSTTVVNGVTLYNNGQIFSSRGGANVLWNGRQTGTEGFTSQIFANGTATFTGNISAPNINFKLAPATVAAMPAPLIDEGFAANNEIDLLSVIMEMKLQIRDLNAFMQRSTQDQPET